MQKKAIRFFIASTVLTVALAATFLIVSLTSALATAPSISGVVTFPDGTLPSLARPLPPGTFVWLLRADPDPERWIYGMTKVATDTGQFNFALVPPDSYFVRAVPPPLPYAPSRIVPVRVFTGPVQLPPIRLTHPSITGTVYAPDRSGTLLLARATVHVFAGPRLVEKRPTTMDGRFSIGGLPAGTYKLVAEPMSDNWYWWSRPVMVPLTPTVQQYVSLTLDLPQVHGVVLEGPPPYRPVPDARVHAVVADGRRHFDVTGRTGKFAIGGLRGVTATLFVEPPLGRGGLLPPPPRVVNIPLTRPITLTFGVPDKMVRGRVRTNTDLAVAGALVAAHRVGWPGRARALTDLSGYYTLTLSPGLWAVNVHPLSSTQPSRWVYPYPARLVHFGDTPRPERKFVSFIVLTADATVRGAVELPNHTAPPFPVTVTLHTDEGIGLSQPLDNAGRFSFRVPHGLYKLDLRFRDPRFAAPPALRPVYARPESVTQVPTITLIVRNAIIGGQLTAGSNVPVEGVPVVAWNPDTHATFGARSGPGGIYITAVYSGTWLVRPAPLPRQPYVFAGEPLSVEIKARQVISDVNFALTPADATIHGVLVANGTPVTNTYGWAAAVSSDRAVHTGAPVERGEFDILVPAGTYTVALHLPGGQRYMAGRQPQSAIVGAGEIITLTFPLLEKTAMIRGVAYDKRTEISVDVNGRVWAWDNGLWTGTDLKPGGRYTLPVPAGDWGVNYAIDPQSDYLKAARPRTYALQAGQVQNVPLPVVRKDGLLTGTVTLPDGTTPARGAVVVARGTSPDIDGLTVRALVRPDGRFAMELPHGQYNVRSARVHEPGLINPAMKAVAIPPGGSSSVALQYRRPDAIITGTVSLRVGPAPARGRVLLWAWSDDDGYNATVAPLGGVYTLPVISGQSWNVVAVFETPSTYWITRTVVAVSAPGTVGQDLVLGGPRPKPGPVTVVFDATQAQLIELAGGPRIFIPAGAMPTEGRVILHITPLAAVPHHYNADVLGLSYVFEAYTEDGQPITQNFNQDVVIVFRYDPEELAAMGIDADRLRPAYFSTTTNSWTAPEGFVVDKTRHQIIMQIDHFTNFGLLSTAPVSGYEAHLVYLPVVLKNK